MKVFPGIVQPKSEMPADVHGSHPLPAGPVRGAAQPARAVPRGRSASVLQRAPTSGRSPTTRTWPRTAAQPPYYVLASSARPAPAGAEFQLTSPMKVNNSHQPGGLHLGRQRPGRELRQDDRARSAEQHGDPGAGTDRQHVQLQRHHLAEPVAAGLRRLVGDPRQPADPADRELVPLRRAAVRQGFRCDRRIRSCSGCWSPTATRSATPPASTTRWRNLSHPPVGLAARRQAAAIDRRRVRHRPRRRPSSTPSVDRRHPVRRRPRCDAGTAAVLAQLNDALNRLSAAYKSGDLAAIGQAQADVQRLTAGVPEGRSPARRREASEPAPIADRCTSVSHSSR